MPKFLRTIVAVMLTISTTACAYSQLQVSSEITPDPSIPTPRSVIGHDVGEDYKLARWETIVEYFQKLATASDRVNLRTIGTSTEGNPLILVEIASPKTLKQLDHYRALQARLADPRLIADVAERAKLLTEAKTTVITTCGLHSSEVAASQMSMELAYDLASKNDARTREILDNCIILLVPSANPDGNNKIIDWYKSTIDTPFEGRRMPWLYQKYAGHDNNRDWFMMNLKETRIVTKLLYDEWHPTILHDVHQMGSRGPRFFVPPFFDPVNPNVDPLIHQSLLIIGGHMATELQERRKTGVVFKAIFDNWWQGGNRTTPYRHNVVGILTEAASAKLASPIFLEYGDLHGARRGLPQYAPAVNFPEPWAGGWWKLRDVVDYQKIACTALFTLAARYRENFVCNHLTLSEKALRLGKEEPPFAWLIPPGQRDPGAAAHMLKVLHLGGIEVHRAKATFEADGRDYPAGTFVLLAAQPYRPHLKDMMERQDYPDRRMYPDGPAEPPYDSAGWTLPLQMGVRSVEVVSGFDADLELLDEIPANLAPIAAAKAPAAWALKRFGNADYAATNRLIAQGYEVSVLAKKYAKLPIGTIVVRSADRATQLKSTVEEMSKKIAARFVAIDSLPEKLDAKTFKTMSQPRTALYQPWTSSMDEGWTRLVLEQFEFPYTTIHNADIRAGDLRDRFDCIIVPDLRLRSILEGASDKKMPSPYAGGLGLDGAMQLERFVEGGGTLVLMDSATALATELFGVPARNVLSGKKSDEFFCPGSLLRIRVDNTYPLGYGFDDEAAAFFARSQAFEIGKDALKATDTSKPKKNKGTLSASEITEKVGKQPTIAVARYADNIVLLSGWILGEQHLRNKGAVVEVKYGDGQIVLLGFRVQHRGQPHGTFKFLFNAIYRATLAK